MKKIERILSFFCSALHLKLSENKIHFFAQFIGFGLVGLSNTAISYFTYLILVKLGLYYIIASCIGFFVSVTNSFFWNNRYVFKKEDNEKRSVVKAYIKTILSYAFTGLLLSNVLLYIGVDLLNLSKTITPLISLVITVPLNFILNKLWAFRQSKSCENKLE